MWNVVIVNRDGTVASFIIPSEESAQAIWNDACERGALYGHYGVMKADGVERSNHFTKDWQ